MWKGAYIKQPFTSSKCVKTNKPCGNCGYFTDNFPIFLSSGPPMFVKLSLLHFYFHS